MSDANSEIDSEVDELQKVLGRKVRVYGTPRQGYSAQELLDLIENTPPATEKPCGVCTFASFIVDLNCINLKYLPADDNGVWVTASPRRKYEVKRIHGTVVSMKHVTTSGTDKSNVVSVPTIWHTQGNSRIQAYYCHSYQQQRGGL